MSQKTISAQFQITQGRERDYFLYVTHSLAIVAVLVSNLSIVLQAIGILLIVAALQWQRVKKTAPVQLSYHSVSGWTIVTELQLETIQIMPSTLITSGLIIVHYRVMSNTSLQALVCFRDSLARDEFKKLTVLLKLYGLKASRCLDE